MPLDFPLSSPPSRQAVTCNTTTSTFHRPKTRSSSSSSRPTSDHPTRYSPPRHRSRRRVAISATASPYPLSRMHSSTSPKRTTCNPILPISMPFIIETATARFDLSGDSLLGVLEKSNYAQYLVKRAGLEAADICLCPAVKLMRNMRILESNGIPITETLMLNSKYDRHPWLILRKYSN